MIELINEDLEKIKQAIINKSRKNTVCPHCDSDIWECLKYFIINNLSNFQNESDCGVFLPAVGIVCDNCGYIRQFELSRLGVSNVALKKQSNKNNTSAKNLIH